MIARTLGKRVASVYASKMPEYRISKRHLKVKDCDGVPRQFVSNKAYFGFNVDALGLGNISKQSSTRDAIAAVFDLEGFTNFCIQIEPHLTVPKYLNVFLQWMMETMRTHGTVRAVGEEQALFYPLSFFVKFLGDGLLVLWDSADMDERARQGVLALCRYICLEYEQNFLPTLKARFVGPPTALRCGAARGTVLSIGDNADYVGSCINMASRLQKLPGVSFCFNLRGYNYETMTSDSIFAYFEVRKVFIRGIGENELVCVAKHDLETMSAEDRGFYREV